MLNVFGALVVAAAFAAPAAAEISARPIPIDAFARVPNIQSVSMSTEGDLVVALVASPGSDNTATALATWDLTDPELPLVLTPSGDRMEFVAASALKADRIWAVGRQEWTGRLGGCGEGPSEGATRTFVVRQYLTDPEHSDFDEAFSRNSRTLGISREAQQCFEIAGSASLVSDLPLDPDHVLIQRINQLTLAASIYKYNLRNGSVELWHRTSGGLVPAFFNPRDGELLVQYQIEPDGDDYRIEYLLKNPESGRFEVHPELTSVATQRYTIEVVGIDESSGEFYVVTDKFSDLAAVYMYDAAAQRFSAEPLLAHPDFSAVGVVLGVNPSNFNQLLGFVYGGASVTTYWIDPTMRSIHDSLSARFDDAEVSLIDWTDDFSRVLFSTSSGSSPQAFYLLDGARGARLLGRSRPWLDDYPMHSPELVSYTARDGLEIPAFLTTPAGWSREDGALPTIVLPHGGPWARDYADWDPSGWPQFLASRGYAVLQPQFRGSTGWGRELWLAGDAQWGLAMQDDKDDGVTWLVQQGVTDPDRVAIFGYSYGGYAALAAVLRPGGPYQCAIAGAALSNLGRLEGSWFENRLQRTIQGQTVKGLDLSNHADRASIPVLLYHGNRDVRVPLYHGRDFYNAVRGRVEAVWIEVEDMPHSLPWYPRHHRETLGAIERYLEQDCGPGGL